MKYKHIQAWHEARMTFVQIVIPTVIGALYLDNKYPDLKYKIKDKFDFKKKD